MEKGTDLEHGKEIEEKRLKKGEEIAFFLEVSCEINKKIYINHSCFKISFFFWGGGEWIATDISI